MLISHPEGGRQAAEQPVNCPSLKGGFHLCKTLQGVTSRVVSDNAPLLRPANYRPPANGDRKSEPASGDAAANRHVARNLIQTPGLRLQLSIDPQKRVTIHNT
jgi:hypothetical protein